MNRRARHQFARLHPWRLSAERARAVQTELRGRVIREDRVFEVERVAGVDVGFENDRSTARAAVVVLSYPDLEVLEHAVATRGVRFPYVPGYLSFREVPAILAAMTRLRSLPDLILCDGQGYAHPRRFGLACHLGVITDIATIGVAKTRLIGVHGDVGEHKGDWTYLKDGGENIGAVLRTRRGVRPVFVSVGHKVTLRRAMRYTLSCCTRYRLPETTRAAHRLASLHIPPGRRAS